MVIDYSICEAIIDRQPFCEKALECSECHKINIQHHPIEAKKWMEDRLFEVTGDQEKTVQYTKAIWTVRQYIRHKTVHESYYPHKRSSSTLKAGG